MGAAPADEADALDRASTRDAPEKLHEAMSSARARAVEARITDLDGQLAQVPVPARLPSASVEQQRAAAAAAERRAPAT